MYYKNMIFIFASSFMNNEFAYITYVINTYDEHICFTLCYEKLIPFLFEFLSL